MVLQFYNSLTKKLELFVPQQSRLARVYHCGPTVYKRPHLGNMRRFLFADFLHRTLEFFDYTVREVTNITDVGHLTDDALDAGEDKLEQEAKRRQRTPQQIAERVTEQFFGDVTALNIKKSDEYPRATAHIAAMQELVTRLLERGHAYQTASGVYYDVASFPAYGKLSGNTTLKLSAGARVDVRGDKRHPADFALWKIAAPGHIQQWDSPWGRGYPGWHIECSAMATAYLGTTIDIHTGGEDLKFPHHENEIAQAEGASGQAFVRLWLHNGMLKMDGVKLAKRDGTTLTLDTLRQRGYSPLAFRLLVFASHYRSPMDFSWAAMDQATANLETLRSLVRRLADPTQPPLNKGGAEVVIDQFASALAHDLNTPQALAVLMDYVTSVNKQLEAGALTAATQADIRATLMALDAVLGVLAPLEQELASESAPAELRALATAREAAREQGDYATADDLRKKIEKQGWHLEDTPQGPRLIR